MSKILRDDLLVISQLIEMNEKILDVGCGDGNLLEYLSKNKNADCRGIEIRREGVNECVKKGLSVIQGDANYDLADYPDKSFSTIILSLQSGRCSRLSCEMRFHALLRSSSFHSCSCSHSRSCCSRSPTRSFQISFSRHVGHFWLDFDFALLHICIHVRQKI